MIFVPGKGDRLFFRRSVARGARRLIQGARSSAALVATVVARLARTSSSQSGRISGAEESSSSMYGW